MKKLEEAYLEAQASLANVAADINERVFTKQEEASKKRKATNDDAEMQESPDAGDGLEELVEKVERMTQRMDEGIRKMIDGQSSLQSIKTAVDAATSNARANASTQASTQARPTPRRRRNNNNNADEDNDEDDDEEYQDFTPTDPRGGTQPQKTAIETYRNTLEEEKLRYESQSLSRRYANNNEYKHFRRLLHHAQNPNDDAPPLPNSNTWFDDGDVPAPGMTTRARNNDGSDNDSDDDLAVARTTISIRCPLTLVDFQTPLTSKKCPHSFEGQAILDMIRNSPQRDPARPTERMVRCPVPGCMQSLTRNDLHTDDVLIRQIKRIQRAKELQEADNGSEGDGLGGATLIDDDDGVADVDDIVRSRETQIKGEPKNSRAVSTAPRNTQTVVELGSDDDSEAEEDDGDETMEDA